MADIINVVQHKKEVDRRSKQLEADRFVLFMREKFVVFLIALDGFLLSVGAELPPLLVCAKEPVPPHEAAGIVAIEVVVMEVMEPGTCNFFRNLELL